jgi:hypothetical protein
LENIKGGDQLGDTGMDGGMLLRELRKIGNRCIK